MTKYYGKFGFTLKQKREGHPDIYDDVVVTKPTVGKILRQAVTYAPGIGYIEAQKQSVRISAVMSELLITNIEDLKFAEYQGRFLEVDSYDIKYPRVVVSLGGRYNGQTSET